MSNSSETLFANNQNDSSGNKRIIMIGIGIVFGIVAAAFALMYAFKLNEESMIRTQLTESLPAMQKIQADIMEYAGRHDGACVSKDGHEGTYGRFDNLFLQLDGMAGQEDGFCAFSLRVRNLSEDADGKTIQWIWNPKQAGAKWICSGGTLDARFNPEVCQAAR